MTSEKDPDGLDPHEEGAKLDAGKAGYTRALRAFPRAISAVNSVLITTADCTMPPMSHGTLWQYWN